MYHTHSLTHPPIKSFNIVTDTRAQVNTLTAFGDKEKQMFVRAAMHLVAKGHRQKRRLDI